MNQLLLERMDSLAQDSPHVIADQFEPVPGEKPAAPVPITKLTASTEEEILQTIKDYADYNLVCKRKIFFKYCTVFHQKSHFWAFININLHQNVTKVALRLRWVT